MGHQEIVTGFLQRRNNKEREHANDIPQAGFFLITFQSESQSLWAFRGNFFPFDLTAKWTAFLISLLILILHFVIY